MTKFDANWASREEQKRKWMAENGMYSEEEEHSSCGVGLVVSVNGKASRKVVEAGIDALKAIWHRGAVDADGKTGDGAGIHIQIPVPFFYDQVQRTGHEPRENQLLAVGQVFLPRTDFAAQERCRTIVETEVLRMGHYIYGWRHVPVDISVLGEKANATRPEIEQILIRCEKDIDDETFERELYIIRRRIEKAAIAAQVAGLYFCSLSCRSIIYKGMMLAEQVAEFYPDLQDERFETFRHGSQRRRFRGFTYWHLKYLKRGGGFANYELGDNPQSRFARKQKKRQASDAVDLATAAANTRPAFVDSLLAPFDDKRRLLRDRARRMRKEFAGQTIEDVLTARTPGWRQWFGDG